MKRWFLIIVVVIIALNIESANLAPASPNTYSEETFFANNLSDNWKALALSNMVLLKAEEDEPDQFSLETDPNQAFPEPATMFFLGMGLMGLASFKKRFIN
jgi:hypothetical protein